jgi:hypothetical protein
VIPVERILNKTAGKAERDKATAEALAKKMPAKKKVTKAKKVPAQKKAKGVKRCPPRRPRNRADSAGWARAAECKKAVQSPSKRLYVANWRFPA